MKKATRYGQTRFNGLAMQKQTTLDLGVLPKAFSEALQADLSERYDREEADRWLGGEVRTPASVSTPRWTALGEAVWVVTRQMKLHGYLPESVLIAIKSAARDAAVPHVAEHLVRDIIADAAQWCIQAYFEAATAQEDPAAFATPTPRAVADLPLPDAPRSPSSSPANSFMFSERKATTSNSPIG